MARSTLIETNQDLITDSGAVLWSIVQGEQLEFEITLNFLTSAIGYTYEAVLIEAENIVEQTEPPVVIRQGGVETTLNVRVPIYKGEWVAANGYNQEDVILFEGIYYKLLEGTSRVSNIDPDLDPYWVVTVLNRVYLQVPSHLTSNWIIKAAVNIPVYGFFELRVTEPSSVIFVRTWKPVRGMMEFLFSPTDVVG